MKQAHSPATTSDSRFDLWLQFPCADTDAGHTPNYTVDTCLSPPPLSLSVFITHTNTIPNLASGDWLSQQLCLLCFWAFWYLISVSSNSAPTRTCTRCRGEASFGKEIAAGCVEAFRKLTLLMEKGPKGEPEWPVRSQPDVRMLSDWNQQRTWTHPTWTKIKTKATGPQWRLAAPVPGPSTGGEIQAPSLETSRRHSHWKVCFPFQDLYDIYFLKCWSKKSLSHTSSACYFHEGSCVNFNNEGWQCCHIAFFLPLKPPHRVVDIWRVWF